MTHLLDVEAACGDVGGDQQIRGPFAKAAHDAIALLLRKAAVQRLRTVAAACHRFGELVHLHPGSAEDDRGCGRFEVQDATERLDLLRTRNDVGDLANARGRVHFGLDRNTLGFRHVTPRELADACRERGGEERRLPILRRLLEDGLDVLDEAHVEHLVGLVEHEIAHVVERKAAAADVIEQSSRRTDHHLDAPSQRGELPLHGLSAVQRKHADVQVPTIAVHGFRDLDRELAGGRHDEGLNGGHPPIEPGDERQCERGSLARARRRAAQHVASRKQHGNRLQLDGCGLFVAQLVEHLQDLAGQAQGLKGRNAGSVSHDGSSCSRATPAREPHKRKAPR